MIHITIRFTLRHDSRGLSLDNIAHLHSHYDNSHYDSHNDVSHSTCHDTMMFHIMIHITRFNMIYITHE